MASMKIEERGLEMSELKPCHICGGRLRWGTDENPKAQDTTFCENCLTEVTVLWQTHHDNYLKHFNTRHLDKEQAWEFLQFLSNRLESYGLLNLARLHTEVFESYWQNKEAE